MGAAGGRSAVIASPHRPRASEAAVEAWLRQAPRSVDVETVRRAWLALSQPYDVNRWCLPLPVWAQRPLEERGGEAWQTLLDDLSRATSAPGICVYIHVPFCTSKCGFCDSYSFGLGSHRDERIETYVEHLCRELQLWSELGQLRHRPVSTVHLGGGTPTCLGEEGLERIVACCRDRLNTSASTEWAVEATVASLTTGMIDALHELGFRRLHIGVQSLEDPVRAAIGRRSPSAEVVQSVVATRARDWVVSVDLLCGLPHQTLTGFVAGIEALINAGVDGCSLYELLIYPQNRRWARGYNLTERDHLPNYLMFLAGASVLESNGYGRNLFNHWAGPRDRNTYFTFPTRGEDCLAIGTIADGVFGDYHYRHLRYAPYLVALRSGRPGLEGGLRRTAVESRMQPLVTELLSGRLFSAGWAELRDPEGDRLLERWQANALVEPDGNGAAHLTASGAWFAGNLVAELTGRGPRRVHRSVQEAVIPQ
jgi:oxygen-independent coproporphyrinogen-3 oxidase